MIRANLISLWLNYFLKLDNESTEDEEKMQQDSFTGKIIGYAIEVHRHLGPGLLESVYKQCLAHEFCINDIEYKIEAPLPVKYKGILLDCGYRRSEERRVRKECRSRWSPYD